MHAEVGQRGKYKTYMEFNVESLLVGRKLFFVHNERKLNVISYFQLFFLLAFSVL